MPIPYSAPIDIAADAAAIANLGSTWEACWEGLLAGRRDFVKGSEVVPEWPDTPPVGAVRDFGPEDSPVFSRRFERLMAKAGRDMKQSVDDLLEAHPGIRFTVLITSSGGDAGPLSALVDAEFRKAGPSEEITPLLRSGILGSNTAWPLFEALGREFPATYILGACASSLVAASYACDRINAGLCDAVLLVALDTMSRFASVGFTNVGANAPAGATPYAKDRAGTTVSEGAVGILLARNGILPPGKVAASISGTATYCDAAHLVEPSMAGVINVVRGAMEQAGVTSSAITGVYWHGTGTIQNDKTEAAIASTVFPDAMPPSTSTKGALGHTLGASGAFNILAACKTIETGLMPHVAGTSDPEFDNLNLVLGMPRGIPLGPLLVTSLGFGGINAAVIIEPKAKA